MENQKNAALRLRQPKVWVGLYVLALLGPWIRCAPPDYAQEILALPPTNQALFRMLVKNAIVEAIAETSLNPDEHAGNSELEKIAFNYYGCLRFLERTKRALQTQLASRLISQEDFDSYQQQSQHRQEQCLVLFAYLSSQFLETLEKVEQAKSRKILTKKYQQIPVEEFPSTPRDLVQFLFAKDSCLRPWAIDQALLAALKAKSFQQIQPELDRYAEHFTQDLCLELLRLHVHLTAHIAEIEADIEVLRSGRGSSAYILQELEEARVKLHDYRRIYNAKCRKMDLPKQGVVEWFVSEAESLERQCQAKVTEEECLSLQKMFWLMQRYRVVACLSLSFEHLLFQLHLHCLSQPVCVYLVVKGKPYVGLYGGVMKPLHMLKTASEVTCFLNQHRRISLQVGRAMLECAESMEEVWAEHSAVIWQLEIDALLQAREKLRGLERIFCTRLLKSYREISHAQPDFEGLAQMMSVKEECQKFLKELKTTTAQVKVRELYTKREVTLELCLEIVEVLKENFDVLSEDLHYEEIQLVGENCLRSFPERISHDMLPPRCGDHLSKREGVLSFQLAKVHQRVYYSFESAQDFASSQNYYGIVGTKSYKLALIQQQHREYICVIRNPAIMRFIKEAYEIETLFKVLANSKADDQYCLEFMERIGGIPGLFKHQAINKVLRTISDKCLLFLANPKVNSTYVKLEKMVLAAQLAGLEASALHTAKPMPKSLGQLLDKVIVVQKCLIKVEGGEPYLIDEGLGRKQAIARRIADMARWRTEFVLIGRKMYRVENTRLQLLGLISIEGLVERGMTPMGDPQLFQEEHNFKLHFQNHIINSIQLQEFPKPNQDLTLELQRAITEKKMTSQFCLRMLEQFFRREFRGDVGSVAEAVEAAFVEHCRKVRRSTLTLEVYSETMFVLYAKAKRLYQVESHFMLAESSPAIFILKDHEIFLRSPKTRWSVIVLKEAEVSRADQANLTASIYSSTSKLIAEQLSSVECLSLNKLFSVYHTSSATRQLQHQIMRLLLRKCSRHVEATSQFLSTEKQYTCKVQFKDFLPFVLESPSRVPSQAIPLIVEGIPHVLTPQIRYLLRGNHGIYKKAPGIKFLDSVGTWKPCNVMSLDDLERFQPYFGAPSEGEVVDMVLRMEKLESVPTGRTSKRQEGVSPSTLECHDLFSTLSRALLFRHNYQGFLREFIFASAYSWRQKCVSLNSIELALESIPPMQSLPKKKLRKFLRMAHLTVATPKERLRQMVISYQDILVTPTPFLTHLKYAFPIQRDMIPEEDLLAHPGQYLLGYGLQGSSQAYPVTPLETAIALQSEELGKLVFEVVQVYLRLFNYRYVPDEEGVLQPIVEPSSTQRAGQESTSSLSIKRKLLFKDKGQVLLLLAESCLNAGLVMIAQALLRIFQTELAPKGILREHANTLFESEVALLLALSRKYFRQELPARYLAILQNQRA